MLVVGVDWKMSAGTHGVSIAVLTKDERQTLEIFVQQHKIQLQPLPQNLPFETN